MSKKQTNEPVWRAFYTKPRHEKKIKERLIEQEFEVYCPLVKTKIKWSDRWKKVTKPLIPGYIFVRVTEDERIEVLQDTSIVATVVWRGKPAIIRDVEIQAMKDLLTNDAPVNVEINELRPGSKVKVEHGPLSGKEGIIESVSNTKTRIKLEGLGLEIVVEVSPAAIKKLDE